jgi:hypothetical protein
MIRHVLNGAMFLAVLAASPAVAQPVDVLCPSLDFVVVRTDELTPGGTMAGFEKAVADQAKWYADHGFKDRIFAAPVMSFDDTTHTLIKSSNQVMTFHMFAHPVAKEAMDAGWKEFVAEYAANSAIKSETTVCYPQ